MLDFTPYAKYKSGRLSVGHNPCFSNKRMKIRNPELHNKPQKKGNLEQNFQYSMFFFVRETKCTCSHGETRACVLYTVECVGVLIPGMRFF